MADTSQPELSEPHTNGVVDGLTEEEKSKMRPADIDADMREMERRKRVEMMMNSRLFREELERIIETQMKDGSGPSGLLQQISEMMGPQGARFNANVFKNSNCVVPINDIRGVESMGYAKGEKLLRCKLAAVFRLLDLYGWTQGVGGQITARLNQDQEHFLVNPYGLLYHEVTASSLVKVDMQGTVVEQGTTNFGVHVTGFQLHSTIHAARPDIKCIVHIATPSVTAISSMKCGLLPLGQESIVIGEVSNHQYIGGIFEPEEREKITRNLGPVNKVMLLTNRGAICCGETVEEAFFNVYNTVLACETQLKLMPAGLDNMSLISEESKKAIFEASRKPLIPQPSSVAEPSPLAEKLEKRWRIGGTEFEALMRMLDNAGFRTGYIYRHPLIKSEPPRIRNDVEVPPAVSSLGYLLEEEELYKQGLWKGGRKGTDRTRWLNSPNVYQKVEILETGTPDPKKITKWVDQNAEEWVTDGSPTHSSTPVRIESALQFVPKNTNPKEFKQLQQQIKDYRRADKISAGPQSHILEGVTWEEAKKMQDATISGTGEQVVLVGAASKGIIQRGFQHNAMVYKTPYAKNPFDAVTDQELDQYKKDVERKQKGDPYDESQSESEGLSSFNVSRATHESSTAKSPIQSPVSVTSETEEESRDEPRVLRIATKQVPVPSQPEVVLSDDQSVKPKVVETPLMQQERIQAQRMPQKPQRMTTVDATTEFLNEMRRTAIEPRNNVNRRDCGQSSTCSSENEGDTYSSWQSSEIYEKPRLEIARTTTIAEVMKPVLMKISNLPLQQCKLDNNAKIDQNSHSCRKPTHYDIMKRAFLNNYDKLIQNLSADPPRFFGNVDSSAVPKVNEPNLESMNSYNQSSYVVVFNSLTNEDKSQKNNILHNDYVNSNFQDLLFNGENADLEDKNLNNLIENQIMEVNPKIQELDCQLSIADWQKGINVFIEDGVQPFKNVKSKADDSLNNNEEKRNFVNQNKMSTSKAKKRCARKLNVQSKNVSRSVEDINSEESTITDPKSESMSRSDYVDRSTNIDSVTIDFSIPVGKPKKVKSKAESKRVITVDLTVDRRPKANFTEHINLNFKDRIESVYENDLLSPEYFGEPLQAPILVQEVLKSKPKDELKETREEEVKDEEGREHNESQSDQNGNHSDENGNLKWQTSTNINDDQLSSCDFQSKEICVAEGSGKENDHQENKVTDNFYDENVEAITGFNNEKYSIYETNNDGILIVEEETEGMEYKDSMSESISDKVETLETRNEKFPESEIFSNKEKSEMDDFTEPKNTNVGGNVSTNEIEVELEDEKISETEEKENDEDVEEVFSPIVNKEVENEDHLKSAELLSHENQIAEDDSERENVFDKYEALNDKIEDGSCFEASLPDQTSDNEVLVEKNNSDLNKKFYSDEKEVMTDIEDSKSEEFEKLGDTPEAKENGKIGEMSSLSTEKKKVFQVKDIFEKDDLNLKELFFTDQIEDEEEKEDPIVDAEDKKTSPKIDDATKEDNSDVSKENKAINDDLISSEGDSNLKYEDFVNEISSAERDKNSSNTKDDEDFNLRQMFAGHENKTSEGETYIDHFRDIFNSDYEDIENIYDEVCSVYNNKFSTEVVDFEAFIDKMFSMNHREIDFDDMFSVSDKKIILNKDQEYVEDMMDKDSLDEVSLKEEKKIGDPIAVDIRNIELISSTTSSKCFERRDSITEMINSIDMNIAPSKTTYENLPDTDNSLKYNLDPTDMSLIYSLTPSADVTSEKDISSKNTSIEMLGLESLEDLDQPDPFKVVKHDLYDFLDLASVKKPRYDFFYLQLNNRKNRLINSCPNLHFLSDSLSEGSFSDIENCSNQGSDILELPTSIYKELKETEEESFQYELNTTVNEILIYLEKTEVCMSATNFVNDILFDISCLNISIDVKNLKDEAKLLMRDRIHAVFVAKDIVQGLISNLPCFNEIEVNSQSEKTFEVFAPVNPAVHPTDDEKEEKTNDLESSVVIIEEIVYHIIDKFDCQKSKVCSPKRLKETMNSELKNSPVTFAESYQVEEINIQEENDLEGLSKNIHNNDVIPCVCSECIPKEDLKSIEIKKDMESVKEYLKLVTENACEDEADFVPNLPTEEDQHSVQGEELETNQGSEMQAEKSEVEVGTTEEDLSNSSIEDQEVLNLKSKIIKMFKLDESKTRKYGSRPMKVRFQEPQDLNSCEDETPPNEKTSGSNSSPSELHSAESENFAEQEVTSESTDNDTKSDNSKEKEFSKNFDSFITENEDKQISKLWQMKENEREMACKVRRFEELEKSPSFIHFGEIDDVPKKTCACCVEININYDDSPYKMPPIEEMNESMEFDNQIFQQSINKTFTSPSSDYVTCKDESGLTLLDKAGDAFEESDSDENDVDNATYTISDSSESDKNEFLEYSADVSSNLDIRKPGASLIRRLREDEFYDTTLNFADVSASTMYSEQEMARRSARWLDINKQNYYSLTCENLESSREIESPNTQNQSFACRDKNYADYMTYSYDTKEFMKLEKDLEEKGAICCDLKSEKNIAALCSPPKYEDTSLYKVVTQINLADTVSLSPSSFRDVSHDL